LDVPSVGAVILLRPTKSFVLHMQQIGRGMRPAPGKEHLIVLDHAGNIARHGLPDHDHRWSLDGIEKPAGPAPVKTCPECQAVVHLAAQQCPCCGYEFWRHAIQTTDGKLVELRSDDALIQLPYRQIVKLRLSEAQLRLYAEAHGYRPGWVYY